MICICDKRKQEIFSALCEWDILMLNTYNPKRFMGNSLFWCVIYLIIYFIKFEYRFKLIFI